MPYATHYRPDMTKGEKRLIGEMKQFGYAECVPTNGGYEHTWKLPNGRAVTQTLHRLMANGRVVVKGKGLGAKAHLKDGVV